MILRKFVTAIAVIFGALLAGTALAAPGAVGEVSLVIGLARLSAGSGQGAVVARGMPVHAGDRIETEQGGHVHLRFSDGGFVSVRPGSRLVIEAYHLDPAHPAENSIRFTLERGVLRSITGKAAEADHDRFRLNTPLAAIGVRGTDFVVQSADNLVRATVHSGAIVLAPLGEGCSVAGLGPCKTAAARTLSADMGQVMLEFSGQQGVPRVLPINGLAPPDRTVPPAPEEPRGAAPRRSETRNEEVLAAKLAASPPGAAIVTPPVVTPDPLPPTPVVTPDPVLPPPPVVVVEPPPPPPKPTLVWGRWAGSALAGDTMTISYAEAKAAGLKATVGDGNYVLMRPESGVAYLPTNLGRADFTLLQSFAYLQRGTLTDTAKVDSAWLSVDFGVRQYATGITVSHATTGGVTLKSSGSVRDDGMFGSYSPAGNYVVGAVSLNGKEAGYYFNALVPGGAINGLTVWGR